MNQEEADQGLVSFNEIQNQLAETFNPEKVQSQAKEVIANMLLMMAVPYFAGRLKNTLPDDVYQKLETFLKGDVNLKNAMQFGRDLFEQKVMAPLKNQLLDGMKSYVPELKDIDLTKASLSDIQTFFTKSVLTKMRAKLPADIANRLPENFTQEDIFNSVKNLTKDEALKFAKNTLPDDVYKQLEANKDLLDDPSQISDFVKTKINSVRNDITNTVNRYKDVAQQRFNEVKEQIKDKIDENVKPFKDKINELQQAKEDLQSQYENGVENVRTRLSDINQRARDFVRNNPEATDDMLQPFEDERNALRAQAESLDEDFQNGNLDLDSQISNFQDRISNVTKSLVERAQGIRQNVMDKVENLQNQSEEVVNQTQEEGVSAFQKLKTFFTGDEETPSLFQRVRTYIKPVQERLIRPQERPFRQQQNVQEDILEADEDEPQFLAQQEARQIRIAGTQQPQEVLPRLTQRQQQLQQQQDNDNALRAREQNMRSEPTDIPEEEQRALAPKVERIAGREGTELKTLTRTGEREAGVTAGDIVGGAVEGAGEGFGIYSLVEGVRTGDRPTEAIAGTQVGQSGASRIARATLTQEEEQQGARPQPPTTGDQQPPPTTEAQAPQAQAPQAPATEGEGEGLIEGGTQGATEGTTTTTTTTTTTGTTGATGGATGGELTGETTGIITGGETGGETGGILGGLAIGEAIPVIDAIVSIGAIIGSIFGAKALMKEKAPPAPEISGESYEPNL